MLLELTARDGKPLFIDPESVAGIEEKKYTYIYLKNSGIKLAVQETAGEITREIHNFVQNKLMDMMENM